MKFIDLFAGIGGFRLPLEKLGFKCVWGCENDKFARQVYSYHWEEPAGDVREVDPGDIPDFDLLCAGFPCPDFSIAGRREGIKGARGQLFYEIVRIANAKRPAYLLLENVRGLLSSNLGWDFATIQTELGKCGYDLQWQVLNSKNYGVPQNRERLFIIGYLGEGPGPKVFPIGEGDSVSNEGDRANESRRKPSGEATNALRGSGELKIPMVVHNLQQRSNKRPSLNKDKNAGGHGHISKDDGTTYPLELSNKQAIQVPYIQNIPHGRNTGWKKPLPNLRHHDGAAYNELLVKGTRIRRLTPIECERLQGFPRLESFISLKVHNTEVCLDLQKSYVNVETKNHKLLRSVGNAENKESRGNALSAEQYLNTKGQRTSKPVQKNVLISCVGEEVEIHSQKRSSSFASYVESQNSYLQHIKTETFAQLVVGINIIVEKIINFGREELPQNEQCSVHQRNGKVFVSLYGKEITQLVKDAKKDLTILKKHLKYITLDHLNTRNIDSDLITSFFYVISAIIGCIQSETKITSILNLNLLSRFGWTQFGINEEEEIVCISDTQRYKMLGNAITTNVVYEIGKKLRDSIENTNF